MWKPSAATTSLPAGASTEEPTSYPIPSLMVIYFSSRKTTCGARLWDPSRLDGQAWCPSMPWSILRRPVYMLRGRDSQGLVFVCTLVSSSQFPCLSLWCSAIFLSVQVNAQYRLWRPVADKSAGQIIFKSHAISQSGEFMWQMIKFLCLLQFTWLFYYAQSCFFFEGWLCPICFDNFCTLSKQKGKLCLVFGFCSTEVLIHLEVLGIVYVIMYSIVLCNYSLHSYDFFILIRLTSHVLRKKYKIDWFYLAC
jgi:hypothetical protein